MTSSYLKLFTQCFLKWVTKAEKNFKGIEDQSVLTKATLLDQRLKKKDFKNIVRMAELYNDNDKIYSTKILKGHSSNRNTRTRRKITTFNMKLKQFDSPVKLNHNIFLIKYFFINEYSSRYRLPKYRPINCQYWY